MSVLVVTDDVDDEIRTQSICYSDESFYKQLKALEYDSSSGPPVSILQPSSSIVLASPAYYRLDHRRRPCRPQACWVQRWLTYMLTLLLLTNHFHWPLLVLSLSSITFVSAQAPTTTTSIPNAGLSSIKPRPILPPSTASSMLLREDEQQCLPMRGSDVDRICSKTCRARRTPFEKVQRVEQIFSEMRYLPFCSHHLLQRSIGNENFLNETSESECREILYRIIKSDEEARQASQLFATYMKAIDSASKENRYSIIEADCQQAYRTWTCSVQIPFFHRNQLIPPCQTICDEVERVCPTFRPSDREPLFAGQPLFFCDGGVLVNSDYGRRPHCFDTCHLAGGSLQRHSVTPSSPSFQTISPIVAFAEGLVTTPPCFEIQPFSFSLSPSSSPVTSIAPSFIIGNDSISYNRSNTSVSSSATTIRSTPPSSSLLSRLSIMFTLLFLCSSSSS